MVTFCVDLQDIIAFSKVGLPDCWIFFCVFMKSSVWGVRWWKTLVVLACRTWHLYGWMRLNRVISPPLTPSLSLPLLFLPIILLLYRWSWLLSKNPDERRSLSSPLSIAPHPISLSLPLPVISLPSPHLNNGQS